MLYIKSGRLYTHSFSFELPEDMCFVSDPSVVSPDTIIVETYDGRFQIDIGAEEFDKSPYGEIAQILAYDENENVGNIFPVERNGMSGYASFYRNGGWSYEYYEERLGYPMNSEGQNGFVLAITHEVENDEQRDQIEAFMKRDNIKRMIESIKYEPEACARVMETN